MNQQKKILMKRRVLCLKNKSKTSILDQFRPTSGQQLNRSLSNDYLNKDINNQDSFEYHGGESSNKISNIKEGMSELCISQEHIELDHFQRTPESKNKDSAENNYYAGKYSRSPGEFNEQKIKEIDESLKDLEAFIQNKIKKEDLKTPDKTQNNMLNCSQSLNHIDIKKQSQDFIEEIRNKSGMRSQTTRKLIQKIKNESGRSRISNYEVCASVPSLNSFHKDLFADKEAEEESKDQIQKEEQIETSQIHNQKK